MDLRGKMAMLRMEQGQATEHDMELVFGATEPPAEVVPISDSIVAAEPVDPVAEPEEPVSKKKFEDVAREQTEILRQPAADKRVEIALVQQLTEVIKLLTADDFIDKIAARVVAKIDDSIKE